MPYGRTDGFFGGVYFVSSSFLFIDILTKRVITSSWQTQAHERSLAYSFVRVARQKLSQTSTTENKNEIEAAECVSQLGEFSSRIIVCRPLKNWEFNKKNNNNNRYLCLTFVVAVFASIWLLLQFNFKCVQTCRSALVVVFVLPNAQIKWYDA